jgi:hypothetical protein
VERRVERRAERRRLVVVLFVLLIVVVLLIVEPVKHLAIDTSRTTHRSHSNRFARIVARFRRRVRREETCSLTSATARPSVRAAGCGLRVGRPRRASRAHARTESSASPTSAHSVPRLRARTHAAPSKWRRASAYCAAAAATADWVSRVVPTCDGPPRERGTGRDSSC